MAEALQALIRANLAASLAILLVFALRGRARRWFGVEAAYLLWIVPLLAGLASLVPARVAPGTEAAARTFLPAFDVASVPGSTIGSTPVLVAVWLGGAAVGLALLAGAQLRFLARVRQRRAGPAVVGFAWPRMVTPADYEARFTASEREIVRAHERAHIDRQDPRANALAAVLQAVNWFNPLVHLAARHMRLDQELACDAAVVRRFPQARRRYAETLLKTQLAARALPLGCHWGPASRHPLEARIAMLGRAAPAAGLRRAGVAAVVGLAAAVGLAAWAAQPARAAQASFYDLDTPQLWSVEVGGQSVRICTDATVRIGFTRPTPVFGDAPCPPDAIPISRDGGFAFQCEVNGRRFDVSSVVQGDRSRDFTTAIAVSPHDGAGPSYRQTRRHRLIGACPSGWIIGDQTDRRGAPAANSISEQRAFRLG